MRSYVIVGNGVAAVGCIEGIRATDPDGRITVVSGEDRPVYGRPLISYYLQGKTDLRRMAYRPADFYEKMGCEVLYGRRAEKLDPDTRTVTLDDGSVLPYTALCAATGSTPFVPPFAGLDTVEKQFSFMTLDDTLALEGAITPDSRVLIVGAGLIGLKCAEGLRDRVATVTVCDLADRVLSSILDADGAAVMQRHLEQNGIRFLLGDTAERFDGNVAVMKSGATVEFDVLVLAVGVRANVSPVADAGGAVERGVVVDEGMRTTLTGVYAAGDCAAGYDQSIDGRRVLAILPNAYRQGHAAGVNMAGGDETVRDAIPMNSIGFFGLHVMTAGLSLGGEGCEMYEEREEDALRRLFVRDGRLVGYMLIGGSDRAGIYTAMIRDKTPLDTVNFDLLKKVTTLAAFSPESRRKKLGGVV